jgi:hypothetical protein
VFEGQPYDNILMALGGLDFGGNTEVNFVGGCTRSMQCDVDFLKLNFICRHIQVP